MVGLQLTSPVSRSASISWWVLLITLKPSPARAFCKESDEEGEMRRNVGRRLELDATRIKWVLEEGDALIM